MKTNNIILIGLALLVFTKVYSQSKVADKPRDSKELQITLPETPTEYSISSYKNVDFKKINPMQLEITGIHTEIYISNTNQGVIIISSAEANKALKDFSNILELNPTYYETFSRQDTSIFFSKYTKDPAFDFTKASSINNEYKNAFNYKVDPRTGVSWSKGNYDDLDLKKGNGYGQLIYDIIVWLPKGIK